MEIQEPDYIVVTPPQSPRRPLTPGLSSGGVLDGFPFHHFAHWQLSPIAIDRCLSASPTTSIFPSTPQLLTASTSSTLRPSISPGTYVAFALATPLLAEQFDKESDTHQMIRDFDRNRYLGLVSDSFSYVNATGEMANEVVVYHVSRLTPPPDPAKHHYIPIYPTTDTESSGSRGLPLRPNTLFPYANCKQWTTVGVKLTADIVHDSRLSFSLADEELSRFEDSVVADYGELRSLKNTQPKDEQMTLERPDSLQFALPAEIWMDVRAGNEFSDPLEFTEEVTRLEMQVPDLYSPRRRSPSYSVLPLNIARNNIYFHSKTWLKIDPPGFHQDAVFIKL